MAQFIDNLKKNGSGYTDPTAYKAIINVEAEEQDRYDRVMDKIEAICNKEGFEIIDQIVLRHKKSGRVWR